MYKLNQNNSVAPVTIENDGTMTSNWSLAGETLKYGKYGYLTIFGDTLKGQRSLRAVTAALIFVVAFLLYIYGFLHIKHFIDFGVDLAVSKIANSYEHGFLHGMVDIDGHNSNYRPKLNIVLSWIVSVVLSGLYFASNFINKKGFWDWTVWALFGFVVFELGMIGAGGYTAQEEFLKANKETYNLTESLTFQEEKATENAMYLSVTNRLKAEEKNQASYEKERERVSSLIPVAQKELNKWKKWKSQPWAIKRFGAENIEEKILSAEIKVGNLENKRERLTSQINASKNKINDLYEDQKGAIVSVEAKNQTQKQELKAEKEAASMFGSVTGMGLGVIIALLFKLQRSILRVPNGGGSPFRVSNRTKNAAQRVKNTAKAQFQKLKTQNPKTQNSKPKTQNSKPETQNQKNERSKFWDMVKSSVPNFGENEKEFANCLRIMDKETRVKNLSFYASNAGEIIEMLENKNLSLSAHYPSTNLSRRVKWGTFYDFFRKLQTDYYKQ